MQLYGIAFDKLKKPHTFDLTRKMGVLNAKYISYIANQ